MPKVSVICIAKSDEEFERLRDRLSQQTFKDFELVVSTAPSIPAAWNECLSRASGEILVFTESDAYPLYDTWLEEIVRKVEEGVVLKGLEINPTDMNMCNLAAHAKTIGDARFDETFAICEDTEFFARLQTRGIRLEQVEGFPVVHVSSISFRKTIGRSFLSGRLTARILRKYGPRYMLTVNDRFPRSGYVHPLVNRLRVIIGNVLFLLGLLMGVLHYSLIFTRGRDSFTPAGSRDQATAAKDSSALRQGSVREDRAGPTDATGR